MPVINPSAAPAVVAPAVALPNTGVNPNSAAILAAPNTAAAVVAAQAALAVPLPEDVQPAVEVAAAAPAPASQAVEVSPGEAQGGASGATTSDATATAPASTPTGGEPVGELTPSQKVAAKIAAKRASVAKLLAEIEKLEGQFRAADLLDSVKAGSIIVARVGRAETSREVTATVIGVQTLESGDRRLKIYFGEGFDAETVVIQDSQIVDVQQA
ncbi:hypothetical protein X534_gp15 [Ralstonia phage RSB3]|uniref:Uncharacterized protein n=1 Tax=Ralstonia phage RSB3 TaxID=1402875 RepID=U3TIX5_9CAUD|nr:hypothetical protein X534_gp15 [Ralstonia phage RSB3]BAN92326.1 hypothetical protein [Ralstonia phage RSB3]